MFDVTSSPFKSISILYRKTHARLNSECSEFGLTAAQATVILIVCDFEKLTQDEITKRLSLDKSVIAKTVMKLEERGYLARSTNKRDKRTYDIEPTDKAWEVYPLIKEQVEDCFRVIVKDMSAEEEGEFRRLLSIAAGSCISSGE